MGLLLVTNSSTDSSSPGDFVDPQPYRDEGVHLRNTFFHIHGQSKDEFH